jgi:hypothetical protein
LYCTKIYISYGDLVFKQQTNSLNNQRDQQIQWITNDASNGQLISKIYASTLGSTLNFLIIQVLHQILFFKTVLLTAIQVQKLDY